MCVLNDIQRERPATGPSPMVAMWRSLRLMDEIKARLYGGSWIDEADRDATEVAAPARLSAPAAPGDTAGDAKLVEPPGRHLP
ncbi:MAG TPA: hypothetical protein VF526_15465 [Solirubrobacteraceae bacterium]|jgi:hypothetical protein